MEVYMKYLGIILALTSLPTMAGGYVDLGLGGLYRQLEGDSLSYKGNPNAAGEFSLGYMGEKWDFGIDGLYTYGRQKDLNFRYTSNQVADDFNWHSFSVGPTVKYHIKSASGDWTYAPFVGVFYNSATAKNSVDLRDGLTGKVEDNSSESWGYGGKLGVQLKNFRNQSTWLEAINYKVFASYTKYRGTEGDFISGNRLYEYDGDSPDNLTDYSIGFTVGFSLGDKLFQKAKSAVGI